MNRKTDDLYKTPGILSIAGWAANILCLISLLDESGPMDGMLLLFISPLLQLCAVVGSIVQMLAGHRKAWQHIGLWGGLLGVAFGVYCWWELFSESLGFTL